MVKKLIFGPIHATSSYTVKVRGEYGCAVYDQLEGVQEQAECYLLSRPQGVVDVFYSEQCAKCKGAGRIMTNRRTLTFKHCPACKGRPEFHADELIQTFTNEKASV